jgi:hypothetical protein
MPLSIARWSRGAKPWLSGLRPWHIPRKQEKSVLKPASLRPAALAGALGSQLLSLKEASVRRNEQATSLYPRGRSDAGNALGASVGVPRTFRSTRVLSCQRAWTLDAAETSRPDGLQRSDQCCIRESRISDFGTMLSFRSPMIQSDIALETCVNLFEQCKSGFSRCLAPYTWRGIDSLQVPQ